MITRQWEHQELNNKHGVFEGNLLVAVVGECVSRPEHANEYAEMIVRAVNSHDALVDAIEAASKYFFLLPTEVQDKLRNALNATTATEGRK